MIKISNEIVEHKGYRYVLKIHTIRYNSTGTRLELLDGSIILGVHKNGSYFQVTVAIPSSKDDIDSINTKEYHFHTRLKDTFISPEDLKPNKYMHHLHSDMFTSSHISSHLFIEMDKTESTTVSEFVEEDEEPACKTTGLHSTDFNGKCMVCGEQVDKLELI